MNIIHTIIRHISPAKIVCWSFGILMIIMMISPIYSFAAVETGSGNANSLEGLLQKYTGQDNDLKKKFSEMMSLVVSIFTPVIAILVKLVSAFMGDQYMFGSNSSDQINVAQLLYEMWDISRTVVNYIILLTLVFMSMIYLIPKLGEKYNVITYLPKIVLALVMVNITWFGIRVLFDVSEVATHIVYSLPQTILEENQNLAKLMGEKQEQETGNKEESCIINKEGTDIKGMCNAKYIMLNMKGNFDETGRYVGGDASWVKERLAEIPQKTANALREEDPKNPRIKTLEKAALELDSTRNKTIPVSYGSIVIFWDDFNFEAFNEGTIAPLFAYSVMQIQNLPKLSQLEGLEKSIKEGSYSNGWISILVDSAMALIVMIITIIVFAMMLIVVIFRIIIIWVNVMIAPFWALAQIGLPGLNSALGNVKNDYIGMSPLIKSIFAPAIMGLPLVIGTIMIIAGKKFTTFDHVSDGVFILGEGFGSMSDIHQVFYYVLCLAVLWMGSVKAMNAVSVGFIGGLTKKVSGFAEKTAGNIAKLPSYVGFIPVASPSGEGTKLASFDNLFGSQNPLDSYFAGAKAESDANGPYAPKDRQKELERAESNNQLTKLKLRHINDNDNSFNNETAANEIRNNEEALKNIIENGVSESDIKGKLQSLNVPTLRKAIDSGKFTIDDLWKDLNHPESRPNDVTVNSALSQLRYKQGGSTPPTTPPATNPTPQANPTPNPNPADTGVPPSPAAGTPPATPPTPATPPAPTGGGTT